MITWRLRSWVLVAAMLASLLAASAAVAQETGNRAERVRIAFPRDDGTLTPYTFELGYPLMTLVYDTLFWRNEGGRPREWLARSLRRTNAGRRLEIRLREGAKWHDDGSKVTLDDVKFSYEYFKSRYHPRFTPQLEPVERVEVDGDTLAIVLKHATPGFDHVLADVPILPRRLWEPLGDGQEPDGLPVGSGPYRLVRHREGKGYRFRENRDYYLGRPRVGTIDVSFMSDFDETVRALRAKKIDMIPATLPMPLEEELRDPTVEIKSGNLYSGTVLMFNTRDGPFQSRRARRAVSSALDLTRIAEATIGADPESFQADRGYVHPASGSAAEGILHRFDETRARAEFAALDLPPIRVLAPDNDPIRSEAARRIVIALDTVGATASMDEVPPGELAAAVGQDEASPTFQAAIWSTPPLASYSADYLPLVFGSRSEELSPLNYSGYENPKFDELAEDSAKETNPFERRELIRQELDLLTEDAPVVPLFYPKGAFAHRPSRYDGWVYVNGTGSLDKQSFLPVEIKSGRNSGASPFGASGSSGSGIGALGIVALAVIGAVLLVVGFGVVARVRSR